MGYPDWWEDGHKPGKQSNPKVAITVNDLEATSSSDSKTRVCGQTENERGFVARDDFAPGAPERGGCRYGGSPAPDPCIGFDALAQKVVNC